MRTDTAYRYNRSADARVRVGMGLEEAFCLLLFLFTKNSPWSILFSHSALEKNAPLVYN
jgi:hypothetical protein